MIIDANELTDPARLAANICVVGAGAAGIALALALAGRDIDVLVLEAGGASRSTASQDFYRGTVTDAALHSPPDDYRERCFGGSTTIWGGRCMPFDAIDFAPRDWIHDSGWPIAADVLAPYYPAANRLCEAGEYAYTMGDAFDGERRPMIAGFTGTDFSSDTLERFSCPTDFGRRYGARLKAAHTVRVMLNAAVTSVDLNEAGTAVTGLTARSAAGRPIAVTARHVVVATGGLETPRLLLASRAVQPNGIGNAHDVVGRYYMCHIAGTIGAFRAREPAGIWHGYEIAADGTYCRRRLALRADAQRRHRIGNFVARLHHPRIADARHGASVLSALYLGRSLIPRQYRKRLEDADPDGAMGLVRHAANIARDPFAVARFAAGMLIGRRLAARKYPSIVVTPRNGVYSLDFHAEQEPHAGSRIRLGTQRDAFGVPRIEVDWRYTPGDVITVKAALALLAADLERSGVGHFDYVPETVEHEMTRYGAYGGHHIGTARMGDDPRRSVVDRDCRVHGIANLHLAGAAVFPTSSQANPTLTAVALALRLGDRLKGLSA